MRLYVTVEGQPAIIVGYAPGPKGQPRAIVLGLSPQLQAIPLDQCILPKIPKKLDRKIRHFIQQETKAAQKSLGVRLDA